MISWNGAAEKYNIRDWAPEHEKMGKGITLSKEEAEALYELCVPLYITKRSEAVLQWGERKNIKKMMINGELVIE